MITNDQELSATLERIAHFQAQVVHLRKTETNPANYRASASGFLAEIDRMQREVWDYLSLHPTELSQQVEPVLHHQAPLTNTVGRRVACLSVSTYAWALTRGRQYEILAVDEAKQQVKVRGDNERTRWYPAACFDLAGGPAPALVRWRFDDPVRDELNQRDETHNLVDVTFELDDGTQRWCFLVTPSYLQWLFEPRSDPAKWAGAWEPAICASHMIVIRDLQTVTVDWILRHLDQQGELIAHSLPLGEPTMQE